MKPNEIIKYLVRENGVTILQYYYKNIRYIKIFYITIFLITKLF